VAKEFRLKEYVFENIPNAIDKSVFHDDMTLTAEDLEKYGRFQNCILCAARIEGRKSTLNLVKAVKDSPYTLVLVGKESTNQKAFVAEVHREAGANVFFLGAVPHHDLAVLYKLAKVHALISWMETPGLSSLEAGAMDCNLVITEKGDTREYFEDYAFYCEPDDVDSIRRAIDQAYKAPLDARLKQKINSEYHWAKTAEKTAAAYAKALETHPAGL
jgi:glycosyltransferase involved in cell wall biosynthesis